MTSPPRLTAVCVVHALIPGPKDVGRTAIDKRPLTGRIEVGRLGLAGDAQCDTDHHGGVQQALYAYADEDAQRWAAELGREIPPGLFGENLRTSGLDVTGAEIGERWAVGGDDGVLLEVTSPRIPCITFAVRMAEPHWVRRFTEGGAPGAYLRVVRTGTVAAGDEVRVVARPGHGVTIGRMFGRRHDESDLRPLLDAAGAGVFEPDPLLVHEVRKRLAASAGRA